MGRMGGLSEDFGRRERRAEVVAPYGFGHRTWFVKTGVGAHIVRPSFPSAVSVDRAGAQCAPLHTLYRHYRPARRHLLHRASETTNKFRGQVEATQAERQRTPTAWLKTGERSQDTFIRARATAAASEAPSQNPAPVYRSCAASLGFLGGSESGLCPPAGG